MTDPVLRLEPSDLAMAPGGQARATLSVHNPGQQVEGFRLELLGAAATWASAPATVELYPGDRQEVVVIFQAPEAPLAASGTFPFGVRAVSLVDHYSADVAEGTVEVGQVVGLAPKLTPVTSRGRWTGRHVLTLANWGNTAATVRLVATDPDSRLAFLIRPSELRLPVGAERIARIKVRTRHPSLRGTEQRMPFQVIAEPHPAPGAASAPPEAGRPVVDGTFVQRPILSKGFVTLMTLLVLGGAAVAFLLLRPAGPDEPGLRSGFPPAAPSGLTARAPDAMSIVLSWRRVGTAAGYRVVEVLPDDQESRLSAADVDGEVTTHTVTGLAPYSRHCFRVAAVSGYDTRGPRSPTMCADTQVPRGDGAPPGESQWIAVRRTVFAVGNPNAQADADAAKARLTAGEGITPGVLRTTDHPALAAQTGRLLIYEGPFDTQEEAEAVCRDPGRTPCQAVRPGPRVEPSPPAVPTPAPQPPPAPEPEPGTPPPPPGAPSPNPDPAVASLTPTPSPA